MSFKKGVNVTEQAQIKKYFLAGGTVKEISDHLNVDPKCIRSFVAKFKSERDAEDLAIEEAASKVEADKAAEIEAKAKEKADERKKLKAELKKELDAEAAAESKKVRPSTLKGKLG